MIPVESSNIESVGWDWMSKSMVVQFKDGKRYAYRNASRELYDAMLEADSKGKFFHQNVKHLVSERLDEPTE